MKVEIPLGLEQQVYDYQKEIDENRKLPRALPAA